MLFVAVLVATLVIVELSTGRAWSILLINPLINALILLDIVVFGQFGLAILLFTLLLRLATLPFTVRQYQSIKNMQAAQPQMQELNKKYKDPRRRQEEMLKLYREYNINPLGCLVPTIIQFGVFFALYRALSFTVGGSPESLIGLSEHLYPISFLRDTIPLEQHFLWLNLGAADSTYVLPLLVGLSTYVQQRVSVTPNANPQVQQQQQMMTWMMPLMLFWITLSLPSGVGVYWVATNVFSLFVSYRVYGRSFDLKHILLPLPPPAPAPAAKAQEDKKKEDDSEQSNSDDGVAPVKKVRVRERYGKRRGKRKDRR